MNKDVKILLWLDDYRNPYKLDGDWIRAFSPIGINCKAVWVKSYKQFTNWIINSKIPDAICFDHDLGDAGENEYTGYDCAKWLIEYCQNNNLSLPLWNCQSANPVGKDNINGILNNYKKYVECK